MISYIDSTKVVE